MAYINAFILENAMALRLSFFLGIFVLIALWEVRKPKRLLQIKKSIRWFNNLSLIALNSSVLHLLFPATAIGIAVFANEQGWGFFNYYDAPIILSLLVSLIALDFIIYFQHVMFHSVPVLWRLHQVHHADLDYDVTTGTRFHPVEMILSMLIKAISIMLLGAPVIAVILFEIILNAAAMFNHGNIHISKKYDRLLRWLIVTPDMHRIHHSANDDETNSNFGFNLPWWDRLFGTYLENPKKDHRDMLIGLCEYRDTQQTTWLNGILSMPFKQKVTDHFFDRHDCCK